MQTITTAGAIAELAFEIVDDKSITISSRLVKPAPDGRAAVAHLTFIPYPESPIRFSDGSTAELADAKCEKTGQTSIAHHNWKITLPESSQINWPVLPHNPYTDDGHAATEEARLVVSLPLTSDSHELTLSIEG